MSNKRRIFKSTNLDYPGSFAVDFVVTPPPSLSNISSTPQGDEKEVMREEEEEQEREEGEWTLPPQTSYFNDEEWASLDSGSNDEKPMLVVLHGLSGGSYEVYLKEVIYPLVSQGRVEGDVEGGANGKEENGKRQLNKAGWEACVVNARGCARSKIESGVLFNARATWDVRQIVKWLKAKFPRRKLFGAGFSLGGNIITNVRAFVFSFLQQ